MIAEYRDHYLCRLIACSTWCPIDLLVMGPMRVEGSQLGHHHHPTQQMTGVLEHDCAKYEVYEAHYVGLITIHERYTWTDRNHTYPKL